MREGASLHGSDSAHNPNEETESENNIKKQQKRIGAMKSLRNLAQMHRGGIVSCSDSAVTPWTSTQRRFQVLGLDTLKGLRRMLLKSWTLGRKKKNKPWQTRHFNYRHLAPSAADTSFFCHRAA